MQANAGKADERPLVNVVGQHVALGPLARPLLPRYQAWMNDFATQGSAGYPDRPRPWTAEAMAQWYERVALDHERVWFTIYETGTWRAVGMGVLRDIDLQQRTAEFGLTIGDQADRGKGYGTEAVQLLLDLAFTGLGLHNVQMRVYAFNHAGLRAYHKAGFKEIGRRRQAHFMGGGSGMWSIWTAWPRSSAAPSSATCWLRTRRAHEVLPCHAERWDLAAALCQESSMSTALPGSWATSERRIYHTTVLGIGS